MKTIPNITADDKEVFKAPLEMMTPQSVNTIADLRTVDKICQKIEAVTEGASLDLEDAEFGFLRERFDNYSNWSAEKEARVKIIAAVDKLDAVSKH